MEPTKEDENGSTNTCGNIQKEQKHLKPWCVMPEGLMKYCKFHSHYDKDKHEFYDLCPYDVMNKV